MVLSIQFEAFLVEMEYNKSNISFAKNAGGLKWTELWEK
jgi:hypothetical protein